MIHFLLLTALSIREARCADTAGFTVAGFQGGAVLPKSALDTSAMGTFRASSTIFGYDETWLNVGLDAALGAAIARGGFVYDLGLRLGPGHWFGEAFAVGLYTGLGVNGVTARLPIALSAPAGVAAQVNLGSSVSFFLQGQAAWNVASARQGAPTPFAPDEILGRLLLGLGPPDEGDSWLVVGASWRMVEGANIVLVEFGSGDVDGP